MTQNDASRPSPARDEVLEEAARVAEKHAAPGRVPWIEYDGACHDIAESIRALKSQPPSTVGEDVDHRHDAPEIVEESSAEAGVAAKSITTTQPSIGMDERETIARALIEALDGKPLTDGMWAEALKSHRQLESEFGDQWLKSRSMTADAFRQADAIIALSATPVDVGEVVEVLGDLIAGQLDPAGDGSTYIASPPTAATMRRARALHDRLTGKDRAHPRNGQ